MVSTNTTTTKRTARTKKTPTSAEEVIQVPTATSSLKEINNLLATFNDLISKISQAKTDFENLQKEITDTKELWLKEQQDHTRQKQERNQQEEIQKRREQELYEYETSLSRKRAEDEFNERRLKWERELAQRKEEIEKEKKELEELRKQASGFETEKDKAVKEACTALEKDLTNEFTIEKKLREQEFKSEKEMLGLKIATLTAEKTRQLNEIESLKKAFDESAKQLKDVAVKVIESNNPPQKPIIPTEN